MDDLSGRTALVTGASRGIGRGIALALAGEGCDVALNFRANRALAEEVAVQVRALGRKAVTVQADVSDGEAVRAMVAQVEQALAPVEILVNNAGIAEPRDIDTVTEEDWDSHMDVNLKSAFLCTQAVLPGMRARGWGRVLFISSVGGFMGSGLGPHYAASKLGMIALTRYYARQLFRAGITCNALAPALTETDMAAGTPFDPEVIPIGRIGTVEEVAGAAVLAIRNGFMTGETIHLNGGYHFA